MKSNIYYIFMLFIFMPLVCHSSIGEKERPPWLQAKVSEAFDKLNRNTVISENWLKNGSYGFYGLLGLKERLILDALNALNKSDIYIIDVGAAQGRWADEAQNYLSQTKNETRFHIISLTGSAELSDKIETTGNVSQYRLGHFKIENILSELEVRLPDLNLIGKVDLIVSNWTLRHLVDPFGTLEDLYSLLAVKGKLMANGFSFRLPVNEPGKILTTRDYWQIFSKTNANFLCSYSGRDHKYGDELDHFLLEKPNNAPLDLPISYTEPNSAWNFQPMLATWENHLRLGTKVSIEALHNNASGEFTSYVLTKDLDAIRESWSFGVSHYYGNHASKIVFKDYESLIDLTGILEI